MSWQLLSSCYAVSEVSAEGSRTATCLFDVWPAGGAGSIVIGLATQQLLTNAFMGLSLVSQRGSSAWQPCISVFVVMLHLAPVHGIRHDMSACLLRQ
jgi:hypothetical protein